MSLYIGLMSGTSMDGIDAALVEQPTNAFLCGITKEYSDEVKRRLDNMLQDNNQSLESICQLNVLIGREFSYAVHDLLQKAKMEPKDILAIGSHGQTICHDPRSHIPYSLQMGCGHTISSLTGIPVIADFRTKDIVNGGQGAPFAPIYHQELFTNTDENIALVNIGGIANITIIRPNQSVQGWDTGPGNCLMDAWIKLHQGLSFDKDGEWAKQGMVIEPLLEELLSDPIFALAPPKSLGKEYFSLLWLDKAIKKIFLKANTRFSPVDVQASLLALTAHSIAQSLLLENSLTKLYLCGGGTHNLMLRTVLSAKLPHMQIKSIEEVGFSPDYLEAMMFSWFAYQNLNGKTIDLSTVTGSKRPLILGAVYPA